jgi:hypothetical protein
MAKKQAKAQRSVSSKSISALNASNRALLVRNATIARVESLKKSAAPKPHKKKSNAQSVVVFKSKMILLKNYEDVE